MKNKIIKAIQSALIESLAQYNFNIDEVNDIDNIDDSIYNTVTKINQQVLKNSKYNFKKNYYGKSIADLANTTNFYDEQLSITFNNTIYDRLVNFVSDYNDLYKNSPFAKTFNVIFCAKNQVPFEDDEIDSIIDFFNKQMLNEHIGIPETINFIKSYIFDIDSQFLDDDKCLYIHAYLIPKNRYQFIDDNVNDIDLSKYNFKLCLYNYIDCGEAFKISINNPINENLYFKQRKYLKNK